MFAKSVVELNANKGKKMKFLILICTIFLIGTSAQAFITDINGITHSCEPIGSDQKSFYCTIESTFDGSFGGSGKTELEAKQVARSACRVGSRSNGFFCEERTLICDSSD